ncbi:hypothetical protein JW935_13220 [candidate division KSB1 bacterium]|nr:hypothetical protein [candidate division KSB1 bacterium]
MTWNNNQKRTRELEIARQFKKVLSILPVDFYDAVISAFIDSEDPRYLEIQTELAVFKENKDRADLVCKFPTFKEIIFEFKLGDENVDQVKRYSKNKPEAKIISISKKSKFNEVELKHFPQIKTYTWQEVLNGFLPIISPEMQEKLKPTQADTSFYPAFPERRLGDPTLFVLENFLILLKEENLITTKGEKVLVVTGEMASKSTCVHNVYWFGLNWNRDFQYLVVVHQKKLVYVGEVIERIFDKQSFDQFESDNIEIIKKAYNESPEGSKGYYGQPVIVLKEVEHGKKDSYYAGKGAITQSHRYFNNLSQFFNYFSNPN